MTHAEVRTRIVEFTREQAAPQLQFLVDLSHQNSYSYNKAGTDRVASMILEKIGPLFPAHRVVRQSEVGDLHLLSNVEGERSIYLLGHLDTVFPPDHPFRECSVEGDRLHGPGCGDMKAGLASIVYAVLALDHVGLLEDIPLTVALGGDEEIGAITSRPVYERERERALACLVVEGGGANGEIVVSRYGKMGLRLDCHGQDLHVGADMKDKASAVLELAHKTIGLEALNGVLPGVRVNVGKIEGGLGPATVPAHASALVDVRWEDQDHRDQVLERIEALVSREDLPGRRSELTILNERGAWPFLEGTRRLAEVVQEAGKEIGRVIALEHRKGTSDSNFFGSVGVPTVDGLGPICEGYHTPGEFVYISSIQERTALLALALPAVAHHLRAGGSQIAR
ncbi:M20/M25/M40 family metallo-hydrolase [Gemmatimonadota bacterium]